ncbi:MAG: hypothetical protein HOP08_14715 [Cyclobacteriaceae bacterium]|nr:hypothetical protein [Cyclobacteriaceae bacterium]
MTYSHYLTMIALVLLSSCSPTKLEKTNPAITGFPTPVYEGMIDVASGKVATTLPMHKIVYVMNDKLTVNDVEFVKIHWNDTVGYVASAWLLQGGQQGVIDSSEENPITIFSDPDLKVASGNTFTELQMVSFKKSGDQSSQIIYFGANETTKPSFGYITAPVISDSLSVQFYLTYTKAFWESKNGDPAGMTALMSNNTFASLPLYHQIFQDPGGEDSSEEDAYGDGSVQSHVTHVPMEWRNADGNIVDANEVPGQFELHYIWDDDTESDGNHLGDRLEQGAPECNPDRGAKAYKMVFTPANNVNISAMFSCIIPMIRDKFEMNFENMVPGDTYEFLITHRVYGVMCDETTFLIKTSNGLTGKGMVDGSCGD